MCTAVCLLIKMTQRGRDILRHSFLSFHQYSLQPTNHQLSRLAPATASRSHAPSPAVRRTTRRTPNVTVPWSPPSSPAPTPATPHAAIPHSLPKTNQTRADQLGRARDSRINPQIHRVYQLSPQSPAAKPRKRSDIHGPGGRTDPVPPRRCALLPTPHQSTPSPSRLCRVPFLSSGLRRRPARAPRV